MNCPKCNTIKRSEIKGFNAEKETQRKRYGKTPCKNCMIEVIGGYDIYRKRQQEDILKEMDF